MHAMRLVAWDIVKGVSDTMTGNTQVRKDQSKTVKLMWLDVAERFCSGLNPFPVLGMDLSALPLGLLRAGLPGS